MEWWLIMLLVFAGVAALALVFGYVFKKRFRTNGRIYSFTAYEPEEDCNDFSPAHVCGKNRFYSRLLHSQSLPRYTSRFSFVPFMANRKMIRTIFLVRALLIKDIPFPPFVRSQDKGIRHRRP